MKKQNFGIAAAITVLALGATMVQAAPPTDTTVRPLTPGVAIMSQAIIGTDSMKFPLYAPPTYNTNATKKWPLIIAFNMMGATIDGAKQNGGNLSWAYETIFKLLGDPSKCKYVSDSFIVATPWIPSTSFPGKAPFVKDWIHYLYNTYRIDTTCVSFWGPCWGANFAWSLSTMYPRLASSEILFAVNDRWSAGGTLDLTKACTVSGIPMRLYTASGDTYTKWQDSKSLADAMNACTGPDLAQFTEVNYYAHEVYDWMDTIPELYTYFLSNHKSGATAIGEYAHGKIDGVAPGYPACFANRIVGNNETIDVIDMSGRHIFGGRGNGGTLRQSVPGLSRGIYLVRISGAGEPVAKVILSR
jgi:hypothetical protein